MSSSTITILDKRMAGITFSSYKVRRIEVSGVFAIDYKIARLIYESCKAAGAMHAQCMHVRNLRQPHCRSI